MRRVLVWLLLFVFLSPVFLLGSCGSAKAKRPEFVGDYMKAGRSYLELKPLAEDTLKPVGQEGNERSGYTWLWGFSSIPSSEEVNRASRDLVVLFNYPPSSSFDAEYYWDIGLMERASGAWRIHPVAGNEEPKGAKLELADDRSHALLHVSLEKGLYVFRVWPLQGYPTVYLLWAGAGSPDF